MTDDDLEDRAAIESTTLRFVAWLRNLIDQNARIIVVGAIALFALNWIGIISLGLPSYWPIVLVIGLAVGAGGYLLSERAYDLMPDPERIYVVDQGNEAVYWFSPDEWENIETVDTLYAWDSSKVRAYEAAEVDLENDRVIGNWRETAPDSEFRSAEDIEDVRAAIDDLRDDLEPAARRGKELRRRLPGIVRRLDAQRDRELAESYERGTVDAELDDATISKVLEDILEDDLQPTPDAGGSEDDNRQNGHREDVVDIDQGEYDAILDGPAVGEI